MKKLDCFKIKVVNPILINPFFFYVVFWCISFLFYMFSPSQLDSSIDSFLLVFIIFTIFLTTFFMIKFNYKFKNRVIIFENKKSNYKLYNFILIFIVMEFLYSKNIPLLSSMLNMNSQYQEFGIPTIHVIVVTVSLLICVYSFFRFSIFHKMKDFFYFVIYFMYFLLIFSRGMMVLILSSILCLYLVDKEIKMKYVTLSLIVLIVGCWIFGVLGNIRVSGSWNNSEIIMDMGKIQGDTHGFLSPLYWVEEYLVCSLRNLNYNIMNLKPSYSLNDLLYVSMPDFIIKRIMPDHVINVKRLVGVFTSLTTYSNHYSAFGYIGMFIEYFIYMAIGVYLYSSNFNNNVLKITVLSIASVIYGLSIFDAMLQYSGYSFVLVWGIIIGKFAFKKKRNNIYLVKNK